MGGCDQPLKSQRNRSVRPTHPVLAQMWEG
jgi:hypothetical protein